MVSKWFAGLFGRCPPMKCCKKALPNCSKLSMDDVGNFVNHSLAAPLRVVGKERHRSFLENNKRGLNIRVFMNTFGWISLCTLFVSDQSVYIQLHGS